MKNAFMVFSILCALFLTENAAFALNKKIMLSNDSQVDIYSLKVSPTNQNNWEENLLQMEKLPNGDTATIEISRTENAEAWDVAVTDKNGNQMTWIGLPLNKKDQVTLLPNGKFLNKE